ncbi:MAG: hypothetical protein AAGF02_07630 [Actinomycetota bacterium]
MPEAIPAPTGFGVLDQVTGHPNGLVPASAQPSASCSDPVATD